MNIFVDQLGAELGASNGQSNAVVTQLGAEIGASLGTSNTRINQLGMELLVVSPIPVLAISAMPSSPGAASIEVRLNAQTSTTDSGLSGQVLTSGYESTFTEVTIFLPSIKDPAIQAAWVQFLTVACKSQSVFQLQSQIESLIPANYSTSWWRLQPAPQKLSYTVGGILETPTFTVRSLSKSDVGYIY